MEGFTMCFVSLVTSCFPNQVPPFHQLENWPKEQVLDLAEVLRRLDRIDKALGLRDCKDESKEKFLKELDALIQRYRMESFDYDPLPVPDYLPIPVRG